MVKDLTKMQYKRVIYCCLSVFQRKKWKFE